MNGARAGLLASLALGCACIIPDTKIDVQPDRINPGAVRLVQAVAFSAQANEACAEEPGFEVCPVPPDTVVPGLVALENQAFCACEGGGRDGNALGGFRIFVEDPDVDDDGVPRDTLIGAFLLDVDPDAESLSQFVAYTNYFPTSGAAQRSAAGTYEQPIERPASNLQEWTLGLDTTVDLCNDNNGAALSAGLHSLRLIVTDRPWPSPVLEDDGVPRRDGENFVRDETQDELVGVPDTPAGASYDVADFVFRCIDESSDEGSNVCNCEEVEG
ncbi:MAG: hypothetical protein KUG77_12715 [Nannocystaceae bacterium]|nr:hypothetical protein [Nannocystaceae bacterium]